MDSRRTRGTRRSRRIQEQISISSDEASNSEVQVISSTSVSSSEDEAMETSDVDESSSGEMESESDVGEGDEEQTTSGNSSSYDGDSETTEATNSRVRNDNSRVTGVSNTTATTTSNAEDTEDAETDNSTATVSGDNTLVEVAHEVTPKPNSKIQSKAQQTTPGLAKNGPNEQQPPQNEPSDDEEQSCPICFEQWTNSGKHRLSSLSCGHLFGRSCIERWLKDPKNKCCPQCKEKANRKDIRNIYAKSLKAIDTTDRDQARKELAEEKYKRSKAEENEAKALLQLKLLQAELEQLKRRHKEIPPTLDNRQPIAQGKTCAFSSSQSSSQSTSNFISASQLQQESVSSQFQRLTKKYEYQKAVTVSNKEARVIAYDSQRMLLAVSKPSPNQLFTGYGVLKLSPLDSRSTEYVRIHQKHIRDAKFNQSGDELLLTASLDKTMKLTSLISNSIVQSYTCESAVWACCWNSKDTNLIYAGLQNGSCNIYDIRKNEDPVTCIRPRLGVPCPIVSLSTVKSSDSYECDGVIVGTLQGGWFISNENNTEFSDHQLLFPSGSSCGISYEPQTRHCLYSLRPGKQTARMTHSIFRVDGDASLDNPIRVSNTQKCYGGNRSQNLSRSALFTCPDDNGRLMVCSGDEASSAVVVWDGHYGSEHQKIPVSGGTIFDVVTFNAYQTNFLAALTAQKLFFYKWQ